MGRLEFSAGSVVYMDTSAIIYTVERVNPYWQLLTPLWAATDTQSIVVTTSLLTMTECLVKPFRCQDTILERLYRDLILNTRLLRLLAVDRPVLEEAARIRALTRLPIPDAIHAATALLARASVFVTNDEDFLRVPGLQTIVLSQLPELNT